MRTTVTLAADVAAEVERLRREQDLGVSEALNQLIRRGMAAKPERKPYVPLAYPIGVKIDVSNIGEVLDLLDQYDEEDRARDQSEQHKAS
jgi:hypothetical protein